MTWETIMRTATSEVISRQGGYKQVDFTEHDTVEILDVRSLPRTMTFRHDILFHNFTSLRQLTLVRGMDDIASRYCSWSDAHLRSTTEDHRASGILVRSVRP